MATSIFTRKGIQNFVLTINVPGDDAKAKKARAHLMGKADGTGFHFRLSTPDNTAEPTCAYATDDAQVIAYIRKTAKANPRLRIKEDLSMMPIRCPMCDFTTEANTAADQEALAEHMAEKHTEELGE